MKSLDSNVETSKPSRLFTRRRMLSGMAAVAAAVYTDMRFIEPNWVGIGRHRVPILPPGSAPIRIVQLSDMHASDEIPLDFIDNAVDLGLKQSPDMVCLTGDFITNRWDEWDAYSRILSRFSKVVPTYASTGNHDGGRWLVPYGGYSRPTKVMEESLVAHYQGSWIVTQYATELFSRNQRSGAMRDVRLRTAGPTCTINGPTNRLIPHPINKHSHWLEIENRNP